MLQMRLQEYGASHRNRQNVLIHKICVPMIMLGSLGMMAAIPGPINWAVVFIAASLIYYWRFRSWAVYLAVVLQVIPMLFLLWVFGSHGFFISLGLFVIGWIVQGIGHKIEGHKPSFFEDIQYLWIGPLWVMQGLVKYE